MADFAVVEDGYVTNVIVAEDLETAEKVTNKSCVEVTTETKNPFIGGEYKDNIFYPKKPGDDFFWDEASFSWIPNGYVWNESQEIWELQ